MKSNVVERGGLFFECIGHGSKKGERPYLPIAEPETYAGYLLWKNLPVDKRSCSTRLVYKPICPKGFTIQLSFINYNHFLI